MKWLTKWFIGPHREIRRPVNPVDERLMQRVKAQGRSVNDVLPVRGPEAVERERRKELRRRALRTGDFERAERLAQAAGEK